MAVLKGREVQGTPGTILRYGCTGRGQEVRSSGWQWTEEAEEIFFETLAASGNVRLAADTAGYSTPTVYRQRKMRPDFAAKWQAALAQGYARIEMALVRAAADSIEGVEWEADQPIPRMTAEEAMNLLKLHWRQVHGIAGGPGSRARPRPLEELRDELVRKVEAIIAARGTESEVAE